MRILANGGPQQQHGRRRIRLIPPESQDRLRLAEKPRISVRSSLLDQFRGKGDGRIEVFRLSRQGRPQARQLARDGIGSLDAKTFEYLFVMLRTIGFAEHKGWLVPREPPDHDQITEYAEPAHRFAFTRVSR